MNQRIALQTIASLSLVGLAACSTPTLPSQDASPDRAAPDGSSQPDAAAMDSGSGSMDAASQDALSPPDASPDAASDGAQDAGDDAMPEEDAGPETGRTLTFVLNRLTIEASGGTTLAGYNFDGIFSGPTTPRSCSHADVGSSLDLDQNQPVAMIDPATGRASGPSSPCMLSATCKGGVDNVLPEIADFVMSSASQDVRANAQRMIDTGEIAFVVRVSGVDDLMTDPSVTMRVYEAFPTFSTGCTSVMPDREYAIAQSSLVAGATSIDQARFSVRASIVGGRLIPRAGASLRLPVGPGVEVDVNSAILRANLSETALSSGNLGGYARGGQFYDAVVMMNPSLAPLAAIAIGQFVDLEEPIPAPGSTSGLCSRTSARPPQFGNIGIGALFSAVRATVAATPAAARGVGTCGSM